MSAKQKTVWLVTRGIYSDYSVIAAFTTEDLAKAAVAEGLGEDYEDMAFLDEVPKPVPVLTIRCMIPVEGGRTKTTLMGRKFFQEWEQVQKAYPGIIYLTTPECERVNWGASQLVVRGTDFDRVRHAFGDYKAEIQAAWEWLT